MYEQKDMNVLYNDDTHVNGTTPLHMARRLRAIHMRSLYATHSDDEDLPRVKPAHTAIRGEPLKSIVDTELLSS